MKSFIFYSFCLYMLIAYNNPLQGMDNPIGTEQKSIELTTTWRRAQLGEFKKKEINRFLDANVLAISYSDKSADKKIKLLNDLFTQAFCADAIKNPFEKKFYGMGFNNKRYEPCDISISYQLHFTSVMEFTTIAGNDFLLEQAVKKAVFYKNDPYFQEKMDIALFSALENSPIHSTKRFEIFKKYGASFNLVLKNEDTLLHRYIRIIQTGVWLLENTDIDVNKQNNKGCTAVHYLATTPCGNSALLEKIFNALIKKNVNLFITNKKGQTARDVARKDYHRYKKMYYARNARLLNQIEKIFDRKKLSFTSPAQFVLKDCNDTIKLMPILTL